MSEEMKLIMALCDALGFEVVKEPGTMNNRGVVTSEPGYMLTKKGDEG